MDKIAQAHAAAAAASLLAGAAAVATRIAVAETDALTLVFYRYAIAVACFVPFLARLWPKHPIGLAEHARIAAFGILFFVLFPWCFSASLVHIPAARGAVGLATIPIQTLVVAVLFGRERLTANKLVGVLLAFTGIALAFGGAAFGHVDANGFVGDGLMLLGALCAAVYSVFSRATLMRHGPLFVTALAMFYAVAALVPVIAWRGGLLHPPALSPAGWNAVLFLGTFAGAVQFSLFMWALRLLPPTTTVLYLTLNPVTAMALGVVMLGERIAPAFVVGLALVLTGILVGAGAWPPRRIAGRQGE